MRKLAWFSGAFAFAALLCVYVLAQPVLWLGIVSVVAGVVLACCRHKRLRHAICILLGFGVGMLWIFLYFQLRIAPMQALTGSQQEISGYATSYPVTTSYGSRVDVRLVCNGVPCRAQLYLRQTDPAIEPGDQIFVQARLTQSAYRYRDTQTLYASSKGYALQAYAQSDAQVISADQRPLWAWPAWLARQLGQQISALFPEDVVPFLQALLTGDRSGFTYAHKNALSLAGVSHVVAISGMHVSILLAMLLLFLRRRGLAAAVGIPVVLCYMLLTGASPSVVRASVMQILLLLAPLAKRETDTPTSLCAAMFVILLANPWAVADLSFQLSFASVAGLLLFGQKIYHALGTRFSRRLPPALQKCRSALFASASASLSAMVFTTPLVAASFGLVSLVSVAVNLLTLWAVSLCFQIGLAICLVGFVLPGLAALLGRVLAWLVRYFWLVVLGAAKLPFAAAYTDGAYLTAWLVFSYLLLAVFLIRRGRQPMQFALCILLALVACTGFSWLENQRPALQTSVLDVGQGQSVLLEVEGKTILIDCGGSVPEEAGELAARSLLGHGRFHLDMLILTHYDTDHAGGVAYLLRRMKVRQLYLPPALEEDALHMEIVQVAGETGTALQYLQEDLTVQFGKSKLQIFAPLSYLPGNDGGLSVLCSQEGYDILVTGDMSIDGEARLLQTHTLPQVELLLAGHHGAATSTGAPLLEAVCPQTVVISVGSENRYGHPAPETLRRLHDAKATVFRTDQAGTVTVRRCG